MCNNKDLIDLLLTDAARTTRSNLTLLDVGTGSGAIAISFLSETKGWSAVAIDSHYAAVRLAKTNAKRFVSGLLKAVCE